MGFTKSQEEKKCATRSPNHVTKNWHIISINCVILKRHQLVLCVYNLRQGYDIAGKRCRFVAYCTSFIGFSLVFLLIFVLSARCAQSFQTFPFYNRFYNHSWMPMPMPMSMSMSMPMLLLYSCKAICTGCLVVWLFLLLDTYIVLLLLMSLFYTHASIHCIHNRNVTF